MKTKNLLLIPCYIASLTMMCCASQKKQEQKLTKKTLYRKSQSQPILNKPKTSYSQKLPQRALSSESIPRDNRDNNEAFYLDALEQWKKKQDALKK